VPYTAVRRGTVLVLRAADQAGLLAQALERVAAAGINLVGLAALAHAGTAHFVALPEQLAAAKRLAAAEGVTVEEWPALVFEGVDQPGALVDVTQRIAAAGISLRACLAVGVGGKYLAILALGPADIERAAGLFGV
jgi:hypothetical protein